MKKFFKSFLIALLVSISLHLLYLLVLALTNQLDNQEILETKSIFPLTFSLFFFPTFFSYLFFKKDDSVYLKIIKPAFVSILIVGVFEMLFFKLIKERPNFGYLDTVFVRVISISFIVSFFFTMIQMVINHSSEKNKINYNQIKFSWKIILLIPLFGGLLYSLIIGFSSSFTKVLIVWFNLFPIGVLFSILSFFYFKNNYKSKINYSVFYYYLFGILIFVCISIYLQILYSGSLRRPFSELFINSILPNFVLFTPYFFFIIILIHLYFLNLIGKQKINTLTQQSLESQLNYQQLKNQLSPHFLFNNINVLTSLIEENPTKAVRFSENLSHIYRYFLEQEKQYVVLVKDEIEFAKSYLELLKDRFEIGLNFSIFIDEKSEGKYIVSTILQQVLENVVKHNEINEMKIVDIKITSKENYLIIENNKNPKIETLENSKKGIENIKKRIAFFTDEKVIIEDRETYFLIKLPILETV